MFKHITSIISNLFKQNKGTLPYKRAVGSEGEQIAVKFLKRNGYKILQRNYRCRIGEIDIICFDHGTVVFVEVKTRHGDLYGPPELSVTKAKKRRILRIASQYISKNKIEDIDLRFDVVSIFLSSAEKHPEITHFKYAITRNV
jgi:putative endonuclease